MLNETVCNVRIVSTYDVQEVLSNKDGVTVQLQNTSAEDNKTVAVHLDPYQAADLFRALKNAEVYTEIASLEKARSKTDKYHAEYITKQIEELRNQIQY